MKGCRDSIGFLKSIMCGSTESDRIQMALQQPQTMQNYTEIGFAKIKAPKKLFDTILQFWEKNKDNGEEEEWGMGNTYTNNWESKSLMVSVEDGNLRGGGGVLQSLIWEHAKEVSA
jgi:hypothetical protein